jgi:hypothetical protein
VFVFESELCLEHGGWNRNLLDSSGTGLDGLGPNKEPWAIELEVQPRGAMVKAGEVGVIRTQSGGVLVGKPRDNLLENVI